MDAGFELQIASKLSVLALRGQTDSPDEFVCKSMQIYSLQFVRAKLTSGYTNVVTDVATLHAEITQESCCTECHGPYPVSRVGGLPTRPTQKKKKRGSAEIVLLWITDPFYNPLSPNSDTLLNSPMLSL